MPRGEIEPCVIDSTAKTLGEWLNEIVNCENLSEVFSLVDDNNEEHLLIYRDQENKNCLRIMSLDRDNLRELDSCKIGSQPRPRHTTKCNTRCQGTDDVINRRNIRYTQTNNSLSIENIDKEIPLNKYLDDFEKISEGGARKKRQGKRKGVVRSKKLRRKATKRSQKKRARNLKKNGKGRV